MMLSMRTTVTIDPDVARRLKAAMHQSKSSFKETLNRALRAGLGGATPARRARFVVRARPLGLRPGIDGARLNQLADDLHIEAFAQKHARGRR